MMAAYGDGGVTPPGHTPTTLCMLLRFRFQDGAGADLAQDEACAPPDCCWANDYTHIVR